MVSCVRCGTRLLGIDVDEASDQEAPPLAPLDTSEFIIGHCAYAISAEISSAGATFA